jgi:hypothetical protein
LIVIVGLAALTLLGEAAQSSSSAQTAISGPAAECNSLGLEISLNLFVNLKQYGYSIARCMRDVCCWPILLQKSPTPAGSPKRAILESERPNF